MKKIDVGQVIAILANVGVIAGIAFLAFELKQNNKLLRAQAGYNLLQDRAGFRDDVFRDAELAEFVVRVEGRDTLSAVDERRVRAQIERTILNWQWEYGQYVDGNLAEGELPISAIERTLAGKRGYPGTLQVWESFKYQLRPDFVEFIDGLRPGSGD